MTASSSFRQVIITFFAVSYNVSLYNVLIINNDILPMLELVASKEYDHLEIARPGDVVQFRYEVVIGDRNIMNWQLVHAYKFS